MNKHPKHQAIPDMSEYDFVDLNLDKRMIHENTGQSVIVVDYTREKAPWVQVKYESTGGIEWIPVHALVDPKDYASVE